MPPANKVLRAKVPEVKPFQAACAIGESTFTRTSYGDYSTLTGYIPTIKNA